MSRLPEHRNVAGMPCAPVARAAVDAARRLTLLDDVRAVLAEVVQRRLTTVQALAEELRDGPTHGSALPRRVLREVSAGVRSVAEAKARQVPRDAGIAGAVWNQSVLTRDGRLLGTPDAVWVDLGVALEIDSIEFHLGPREYRETLARRARFAAAGVIVVAVVPSQLTDSPDVVVAAVRGALEQGAARPSLGLCLAPRAA
jgi:hypothetical protein